jgi:SAM-dependent methyltransferase
MAIEHSSFATPSPWVTRFAPLIAAGGEVLDYACGGGRHARWLAARGFRVEAVDRDGVVLELLAGLPNIHPRAAELEDGPWPYAGRRFDAVVVTNYLFRPRLQSLLGLLGSGGVLIYETFMAGNERLGKPSNPDFLLRPGELLDITRPGFSVVAFEQGEVALPKPAVIQRICAVKGGAPGLLLP